MKGNRNWSHHMTFSTHNTRADKMSHLSERRPPRWRWWFSGAVIALAIIAVTSTLSPYVRHQWALSLGRQPTSYTELAFTRASALPTTAVRQKKLQISFTITNDEEKPIDYRYVLSSGSGTQLKSLSSSSNTVNPGAVWRVNKLITPECQHITCRIQVSLPLQHENIDLLLTLRPST